MAKSRSILLAPLRIITLTSNPCRLCSELDGYTDAECLRFAVDLRRVRLAGIAIAVLLVVLLGAPLLIAITEGIRASIPSRSGWADEDTAQGRAIVLLPGVVAIAGVVWASLLPYCFMLRTAVRRILKGLVCRKCLYSLVGLPIVEGAICCPECASRFVLADNGFPEANPENHRPEPRSLPEVPSSRLHMYLGHIWGGAFLVYLVITLIRGPIWFIGSAALILVVGLIVRWRRMGKQNQ